MKVINIIAATAVLVLGTACQPQAISQFNDEGVVTAADAIQFKLDFEVKYHTSQELPEVTCPEIDDVQFLEAGRPFGSGDSSSSIAGTGVTCYYKAEKTKLVETERKGFYTGRFFIPNYYRCPRSAFVLNSTQTGGDNSVPRDWECLVIAEDEANSENSET